jgi:hypothetical protein
VLGCTGGAGRCRLPSRGQRQGQGQGQRQHRPSRRQTSGSRWPPAESALAGRCSGGGPALGGAAAAARAAGADVHAVVLELVVVRYLLVRLDVAQGEDADAHLHAAEAGGGRRRPGAQRHLPQALHGQGEAPAGVGIQRRCGRCACAMPRPPGGPGGRQAAATRPLPGPGGRGPTAGAAAARTSPVAASCHFCVSQLGSQLLLSRRAMLPLWRASMNRLGDSSMM